MQAGQLISDRYELTSSIGQGGMAEVWSARDSRLGRDVAVKFLDPKLAEDPEFLVRFISEAQAVARISSPSVVSILDFGGMDGRPYLVMEQLEGGSVADLGGTVTIERALELTEQAARGAGAAHDIGVIHRDIKPANILLDDLGNAKLADFGIASSEVAERMTQTGKAIGSPYYISPEQVSGTEATPASDVYALGVVLYESLTGEHPFDAPNVTAIAIAHVDEEPVTPSSHNPDIPAAVDALVLRCLAKDPSQRYANGNALADAIASVSSGLAGIGMSTAPNPVVASDETRVADASGKGRGVLASIGVVVLLLGLAATALFASTTGNNSAEATISDLPAAPSKTASSRAPTESAAPVATAPSASPSPSATAEAEPSPSPKEKGEKKDEAEEEPDPTPTPAPTPTPSPTT